MLMEIFRGVKNKDQDGHGTEKHDLVFVLHGLRSFTRHSVVTWKKSRRKERVNYHALNKNVSKISSTNVEPKSCCGIVGQATVKTKYRVRKQVPSNKVPSVWGKVPIDNEVTQRKT